MIGGLCLRCGEEKQSAWVPCPACEFEPITPEDRARHYLVAERLVDSTERERLRQLILGKRPLGLDEQGVATLASELGEESLLGVALFGLVVGLVPLSLSVFALLLVVWMLGGFA